jgi:hypothetical protein
MLSTPISPSRFLITRRSAVVADVLKVNGKLCGVEELAVPQVVARGHDFVPGFEGHNA